MNEFSSEARQRIVREELRNLKAEQYITEDTYIQIVDAQNKYYTSLVERKKVLLAEQHQVKLDSEMKANTVPRPKVDPVIVKKSLSPQEVRERNITWSLNLGVLLLLIGGLVLATSTWDMLNSWMKTGLIALVALLFFGLAYFTKHVLKIERTAFAFHVLGSLFLPIIILSAGYFELFGSYFSFTGEGRFLYGAIGCLAILPVYLLFSVRLISRLFVWFSYVTVSILVSFLLAALYLPVDGFYFGIMAFNGVLIIGYHYLRKNNRYQLFTQEFVAYIQANLVLSTFLMLIFYNDAFVYGFTLILTALLYFAMIFVTNRQEYHFVFSIMLVYGAYQLIEFSVLHEISGIAYALLGFIFLALPQLISDNTSLQKAFRYTSAIVSACAFLYISFEGILLRMNEPSITLFIAYIIISLNFTFLANMAKKHLFYYISPIFLVAALYQAVLLGQQWFGYQSISLPMFFVGLLMYIGLGCYMNVEFFKNIRESSRDIAILVMVFCILSDFVLMNWMKLGTMLLLLSVTTLFMDRFEKRKSFTESMIASWAHAITLGLAVIVYYGELVGNKYYDVGPSKAEHFVVAGLIVLLVSFLWKRFKREGFYNHSFFVAHGLYVLGILQTFILYFDDPIRSLIVFGGIGMAYLLYRKTKWTAMPYIVSVMSLLFYHTVLYAIQMQFNIQSELYNSLQFVTGAMLLLVVGLLIGKGAIKLKKSFWWIGHLYLPIALLYSNLFYGEKAIWAFVLATAIYGISLQKVKFEWMTKTFLYACFTSFWIVVNSAMFLLELREYSHYSLLVTSIVIAVFWIISKDSWTQRIAYYLIPFSVLGMGILQFVAPYDLGLFIATLLYAAGLLFIMHREKWDMLNIIPLFITFLALSIYSYGLLEMTLFALVLTVIGLLSYKVIYQQKDKTFTIDWYTVMSFYAMLELYYLTGEALWTKLLPGLLIAANLLLQRKRIPSVSPKWMVFIAGAFLLQPYYMVLGNVSIPALIERELYVLPWVILVIFLKKVPDQQYREITNYVQWAVLVIVSLFLIQDTIASPTVYDALILGSLALVSILAGMVYQMKSFFFVGVGVLLLNVFLQTRPYWGDLPWWAYLLIAGSILITFASYNEWYKQKSADGKETILSIFKEKVINKIKKWE